MADTNVEEFDFEDQRPDEEIIILTHQHPWVLAKAAFITIVLVAVTLVAFLIWHTGKPFILVLIVAILILAGYLAIRLFIYRNSVFVLTNHRVIYISQDSLFRRKVQEVELENIFNLQYKIDGMMRSLLNFGNIELTTVGNQTSTITIASVENPHYIFEKVSDARKKRMSCTFNS